MRKQRMRILHSSFFLSIGTLFICASFSFNLDYIRPTPPPFRPPTVEAAVYRPWTCHGSTNRDMVQKLSKANIISSKEVYKALVSVDRANYVHPTLKSSAYDDSPLRIGYGQTISAPHMHAYALEEIIPALRKVKDGEEVRILDVGSGSGYLTASLGRLLSTLGKNGKVFGIDSVPELVKFSKSNIKANDSDLLSNGVVSINVGDGWKGLSSEGPFHAIHVGAGADVLPKELANQLAIGGRMVCPIKGEEGYQYLYRLERIKESVGGKFQESDFEITRLFPVNYVPLVHQS